MIIPTVLGCVTAIFAAILQYQNGGLLNVFLKPVRSTEGHSGSSFDIQQDPSVMSTNLMDIVWGKLTAADLAVLAALPTELGGGQEGVAKAIENPNREGQLIVTFLVCLVFAGLGLLAIFVFSLVCCFCCSSEDDRSLESSSSKDQNFIYCALHLLTIVMTALLILGLAISIGYYFGAANVLSETLANSQANDDEVLVWLRGNSSSFSLGRIMQFAVSNVAKFGNSAIESAKTNVHSAISIVKKNLLEKSLPDEISTLVAALMTKFQVMEILTSVDEIMDALNNANKHSNYITTHYDPTIATISKHSFELNNILDLIATKCATDSSQVTAFKKNFNPRNVLPVPLAVTTMLEETNKQLQELKSKLDTVTKQLQAMQEKVMDELGDKLDLKQITESVNNLIKTFEAQLTKVNEQLDTVTTQASGYLRKYSGAAKAVLYLLCLPCLLAGSLFLIVLVFFLLEAVQRHMFSLTGVSASKASGGWQSRLRICGGGGMFCICSGLLLLPVVLFGLVSVVMVTFGGFLHAEVCPYIANSSGIRKTDYVINSKAQVQWADFILSHVARGRWSTGKELASILNLKAPQNLLHSLEIGCDPQNAGPTPKLGLLGQMGIENLVNISTLLESPLITDGIANAKMIFIDGVAGAKLGDIIPNDVTANIKKSINGLQTAFAALNILNSAEYLQKQTFQANEIKVFADSLHSTCSTPKNSLTDLVPKLEASNVASNKLRDAYNGLNDNTLVQKLTRLELGIDSFKKLTVDRDSVTQALEGPFTNFVAALLGSINKTGSEAFTKLTQSLLPCGSLYYAVKSVVFMGCGPSGLAPRVFAWGLFLSLCLFFTFFSLLSLCLLWRVQNHQLKRISGS
uniref:Prominin-1-A n=1 Tax=Schistocephalus solidus TaxID=70667 RepID=A0A0V0J6Z5_SCHSO